MAGCTILLGGMDKGYMQKLALYLRSRFEQTITIGICDKDADAQNMRQSNPLIPVGSKLFVLQAERSSGTETGLILSEEDTGSDREIFSYQSCEKLYREIRSHCHKMGCLPTLLQGQKGRQWNCVTGDLSLTELLAATFLGAWNDRVKGKVLLVNFSECSGMKGLFGQEEEMDLGDLILDMRKGKEICFDIYTRSIEGVECLFPPDNPAILQEFTREDMNRLFQLLQQIRGYAGIWILLGTSFCGCESFLKEIKQFLHLSAGQSKCATGERLRFLTQHKNEGAKIEEIYVGGHMMPDGNWFQLDQWKHSSVGQALQGWLSSREGETGVGTLADYS